MSSTDLSPSAAEPRPHGPGNGKTSLRNTIGLFLGPIVFLALWLFVDIEPGKPEVTAMAAIASLMAIWWVTEAIPIPATALVPIVLFPLMGVMKGADVAREYMSWLIFLFLGGFLIAIAVERWSLHKRIALHILQVIGGKPTMLVLGFMIATAFLSMWLSNTATTMMMMPMALSLVVLYEDLNKRREAAGISLDPRAGNFSLVLLLGLAHSASIGGFATLIGTPPNVVLVAQIEEIFPGAAPISFANWMAFAFPFSIVFLFIAWFVLCRVIFPLPVDSPFSGKKFVKDELKKLGRISNEEIKVALVFAGVALLWMTRKDITFGTGDDAFRIRGWAYMLDQFLAGRGLAPVGPLIDDGTVSIMMALLLFVIPASKARGGRLMDWEAAKKVPWGILLLFGGGLALAAGFTASGLSAWIGDELRDVLDGVGNLGMISSVIVVVAGLTELTSNTATANMTLPIMGAVAKAIEVNPLMLMIPAALAASCAFVLPVSTPPNAIVYGSERIPILTMIKAGIIMELIALVLITVTMYTLGVVVFDVLGEMPDWATAVPPVN